MSIKIGQKGDTIQRTITLQTAEGREIDIPTLSFNPTDRDSVHAALKLIGERLNDQPILQQWIADKIWKEYEKEKKK